MWLKIEGSYKGTLDSPKYMTLQPRKKPKSLFWPSVEVKAEIRNKKAIYNEWEKGQQLI